MFDFFPVSVKGNLMSISSIGAAAQPIDPLQIATATPKGVQGQGAGGDQSTGTSQAGGASGGSDASTTVTSTVTETNANGTITTITTYADGSTTTATAADPALTGQQGALDTKNSGQLSTLLASQGQTDPTPAASDPAVKAAYPNYWPNRA